MLPYFRLADTPMGERVRAGAGRRDTGLEKT